MKPLARRNAPLVVLLWCASVGLAQAGGVYKWVDPRGVTQYDDHTLSAERLTRATIARRAVASNPSAKVPADFIAEVAQQCRAVSERSAIYANARELYGRDPAGNSYRFSAYQVALERARLADEVRRFCRPLAAEKLLAEARAEATRVKSETADP